MFKGEKIKSANVVPGLGERWGRPLEQQLAIKIPEESFPAMTEKIVRGLVYREDDAFIEPPHKIECFLAEEAGAKEVKEGARSISAIMGAKFRAKRSAYGVARAANPIEPSADRLHCELGRVVCDADAASAAA
jgi:hypothetical protein